MEGFNPENKKDNEKEQIIKEVFQDVTSWIGKRKLTDPDQIKQLYRSILTQELNEKMGVEPTPEDLEIPPGLLPQ